MRSSHFSSFSAQWTYASVTHRHERPSEPFPHAPPFCPLCGGVRDLCPEVEVIRRDLGMSPPPVVTETWIAAAFHEESGRSAGIREALRVSDELVDELLAADVYVFGVPMYKLQRAGGVQELVNQAVRVGRTFSFDPDKERPYRGLEKGKRLS